MNTQQADKIIELLSEMFGDNFIIIADTDQHVLTVKVTSIIPLSSTVFTELTSWSDVEHVAGKGMGSVSFPAGILVPFRNDKIKTIQLASGSIMAYYK